MKKLTHFLVPVLLFALIVASIGWYLFVYDRDFTRDTLLSQARFHDRYGNARLSAMFYDGAYNFSGHDQNVAIELANQISSANSSDTPEADDTADSPAETVIPNTTVRRTDGFSSLEGWDCENGISSLDDSNDIITEDIDRPFKCMFARESKIKSGQRAAIILMEDLLVNGILVPKNTHLMAFCNISSRLEMTIVNIEINGRIIPLGYEAYDNDGSPGIYCPDVGSTGQTVKNRGTRIIGSGLTGKVGRTAGEIISTGVSLIQNSTGEKTVTVPAGYTFYIVKKKQ